MAALDPCGPDSDMSKVVRLDAGEDGPKHTKKATLMNRTSELLVKGSKWTVVVNTRILTSGKS
eukprot:375214-Amphidinium_carterae.1